MHWPKTDQPTLAALLEFARRNPLAGFVFGGDQLDLACLSPHTLGKRLYRPSGAYAHDLASFDAKVLKPVEAALPRGAKRVWLTGNHEDWARQVTEAQPELAGLLDPARLLRLKARGWTVVPHGHAYRLGKLTIAHGDQNRGGGKYAAARLLEIYGSSILAGHTHSPQMHSRVSPVDAAERHAAWIAPIVGALNPEYLRDAPTSWVQGFVVVEVRLGGAFNVYPVIVTNGQCSFAGRVYGKRNQA